MSRAAIEIGFVGLRAIALSLTPGALGFDRAQAQAVISDGTVNTVVNRVGNVFTIDNGTISGSNLFHSFSEFSIPTGGSAIFNNAGNIQNIFSRVTGGAASNIDGIIRSNGSANLFLMNPNGILFGANARLELGGSFLGTTAESIRFADGVEFSAANVNSGPLLTVSVPIGLQMGATPGKIQAINKGHQIVLVAGGLRPLDNSKTPAGLQVASGKTLALLGGIVSLEGGILSAPSGHLELRSAYSGNVRLNAIPQGWSFEDGSAQFQDILVSHQSLLNASGDGGSMTLRGQNIRFSEGSVGLIQHVGKGRGGDVILNAVDSVTFKQSRAYPISTRLETQSLGLGVTGEIQVIARKLNIQNQSMINSASYSPAGSGKIRIDVADSISLFGAFPGETNSDVSRLGTIAFNGDAGDVVISTKQLYLQDGANVFSNTIGPGMSGSVMVQSTELVEVVGGKPNVASTNLSTATLGGGNAGQLTINTANLIVSNGGWVTSSTFARGNAGNVVVNASGKVLARGIGNDSIQRPSGIIASATSTTPLFQRILGLSAIPSGNAGSVIISTPQLLVSGKAEVGVNNIGGGNAGNLTIAADQILINTAGKLTASTVSGEGGNISLTLQEALVLRQSGLIEAQADSKGNGGNITIASPIILGLENSDIIANAIGGRGGNITLSTRSIIGLELRNTKTPRIDPTNDITASSEIGINGIVTINNLGLDPNSGLVVLPSAIDNASQKISQDCAAVQDSSFSITGRGGIPARPGELHLGSLRPWLDLRDRLSNLPTAPIASTPTPAIPIEATALSRNPQTGNLELIAATPVVLNSGETCAIGPSL